MAKPHLELVDAVTASIRDHADPVRAAGQQAYMKRALPFLGVRVPKVRSLTHTACKRWPCSSAAQFRATVEHAFLRAAYQEERYAAVSIATYPGHGAFQIPAVFGTYEKLVVEAAWWDITDELSHLFGKMLVTHPDETRAQLLKWSESDDIWLRRVSIIAQVGLKRDTDQSLLFACIAPSMKRPEFFLRKAIGWALRDLAKVDPDATRAYVQRHTSELSPLSKREALKHL
jgi:3-methyladenine DNA glycosylase AlkD